MGLSTGFGRVTLFDDFLGAALRGEVAGVAENSGTAAVVVAQDGGVAGLTTGATSGNRAHLSAGLNWKAENGTLSFEARVKPVTDITARAHFVGLTDTVAQENPIEIATATITSNASDAVGFVFDTDATTDKWFGLAVKGDADRVVLADGAIKHDGATQDAPVADTYETFRIEVNTDGDAVLAYGRDSGNRYGLRTVLRIDSAVTPTVLLTPHIGIETRTTAAKTAYADYVFIEGGRS